MEVHGERRSHWDRLHSPERQPGALHPVRVNSMNNISCAHVYSNTVLGNGWSNNAFSAGSHHRAHASRPVTIRLLVIQACKHLKATSASKDADDFHDVNLVLRQVEQLRPANDQPITLDEMLDICDTEGNPQNGGGSFLIRDGEESQKSVKFEPDNNSSVPGNRTSIVPGDIGSPIPNSSVPLLGGIGASSSVLRQFSSPMGF